MKNLVVLFAGCLISISASAQNVNIERLSMDVAREIQQNGRSLSGSERKEVAERLNSITRILRGGYQSNGGGQSSARSEYTCVSKDNDGVRPFVIAVRTGVDIERTNLTYNSMAECNASLDSARIVGNNGIICVSKDNDGVRPFQMAIIGARGVQKIERTTVGSIEECRSLVNSLQINRRGMALMCISKDNDGVRPFVAAEVDLIANQVHVGTETFNSQNECAQFIRN